MPNNYSAWKIDTSGYNDSLNNLEKLRFFAHYAVLAPSGHNTQPWRFASQADKLLLKADFSRRLPYSGIKANEPYVSLGACLGTLRLAAKGFGYTLQIDYDLQEDLIATIQLGQKTTPDPSLLDAITNRVSNRSFYNTEPLPPAILSVITAGAPTTVSIHIINKPEDLAYVAEKTTQATIATMSDPAFRVELSKWVRNNLTKQYDGMPGFVQGIPTPPSMLATYIIKHINVSKDQAKKDSTRVVHSSNLIIISTVKTSNDALLDAGATYARICTLAQQKGYATAGVGAAIIDPATRQEVIKHFSLTGTPVGIIRIGKAKKPARHTPRWPLEKVLDSL